MNLFTKEIATQLLRASPPPPKCVMPWQILASLQQSSFFYSLSFSKWRNPRVTKPKQPSSIVSDPSKSENESRSPDRPGEIPFYSNVANTVDLIGFVDSPVQFEVLPYDRCVAKTVVVSSARDTVDLEGNSAGPLASLPPVSIPVVFQDDLAVMAKCHLREDDCLYLSGELSGAYLSFITHGNQTSVCLLVQTVNFVGNLRRRKKKPVGHKEEDSSRLKNENDVVEQNEEGKCPKKGKNNFTKKTMKVEEWKEWRELINNTKEWKDYRRSKSEGNLKSGHPDFKHIQSGTSLWVSNAPKWILPGLEGLEFNNGSFKKAKGNKNREEGGGDELWKSLVQNPGEWWDNRSSKKYEHWADFRHKGSDERLWLSSAPEWALANLPPPRKGGGKIAS